MSASALRFHLLATHNYAAHILDGMIALGAEFGTSPVSVLTELHKVAHQPKLMTTRSYVCSECGEPATVNADGARRFLCSHHALLDAIEGREN